MKLSKPQQYIVDMLKKYDCMIIKLSDRVTATGGHGLKFNRKSVEALERKGIIKNGRLVKN